jgi:hypothetical protein
MLALAGALRAAPHLSGLQRLGIGRNLKSTDGFLVLKALREVPHLAKLHMFFQLNEDGVSVAV